jgi:NAD-dependent SIR2 family protein deacetylase
MNKFAQAAEAIKSCNTIIITAGAGLGVDSGLPDFRGNEGFWNAYPPYKRLNMNFYEAANPIHFSKDPSLGWGFYGHRTIMYRETVPHEGFYILQDWISRFKLAYFVVTSNVDGQFQKAGFSEDKIFEVHGSIHHLQCTIPCSHSIWENDEEYFIDYDTMRAKSIPKCKFCNSTARPNVLMFGDYYWLSGRTDQQEIRFGRFIQNINHSSAVVVEIGAGTAVPTIRYLSENLGYQYGCTVIRINPREYHISPPHISLPYGAREALTKINQML